MDRKQILTLVAIIFLPFLFYFARPNLEGADSYYYLNQVCGNNPVWAENFLQTFIFGILPCSHLTSKLILLFAFGASVFAIAFLGELFDKKEGWLAGVMAVGLGPLLFWEFIKFENDQIAYPMLFWALYFFYKWKMQKNRKDLVISTALLVVAGLIWGGAFYWLLGLSLSALPFLPIVAFVLFFQGRDVLSPLLDTGSSYETFFLLGIVWLGLLIIGYLHIKKAYAKQMLFATAIMLLNAKYGLIVLPYLAVSTSLWMAKRKPFFKETVFLIAIMLAGVWGFLSLGMPPMEYQLDAIDYALEQDNNISNDWDLGYWIMSKGGETVSYGSSQRDYCKINTEGNRECRYNGGILVTRDKIEDIEAWGFSCIELERFYKKDLIPTMNPSGLSVAVYRC